MGLFVKNVENVRGDERDIIIFSTTFGRDPNGTIRKGFVFSVDRRRTAPERGHHRKALH
jgi:superfamily I DNA and/or RNA helicase